MTSIRTVPGMDTTTTPDLPVYLTVQMIAARLSIHVCTARRHVKTAGFPAPLPVGSRFRWLTEEVVAWELVHKHQQSWSTAVVTKMLPQQLKTQDRWAKVVTTRTRAVA